MAQMDIPLVLEQLRPNEDWGPLSGSGRTYAELVSAWRGSMPPPTEAEMLAVWAQIESAGGAAGIEQRQRRAGAVAVLASDPGPTGKVFRAMLLVLLDEINLIRSRLVPPLQARTAQQLRNAIANRLNAGDAD